MNRGDKAAPTSVRLSLHGRLAEVSHARHLVDAWLSAREAVRPARDDVLLVAAELTANAVAACRTGVEVSVTQVGPDGVVEVRDDGPGFGAAHHHEGDDGSRGRGLQIVDALTRHLTITSDATGTVVRATVADTFPATTAMVRDR